MEEASIPCDSTEFLRKLVLINPPSRTELTDVSIILKNQVHEPQISLSRTENGAFHPNTEDSPTRNHGNNGNNGNDVSPISPSLALQRFSDNSNSNSIISESLPVTVNLIN